MFIDSGKVTY